MVLRFGMPEEVLQGSRLFWVHSITAGTDDLLTTELVAAEHVAITASKGPHAPLMLSLTSHIPAWIKEQEEHRWGKDNLGNVPRVSTQMLGKSIAMLGVGQIG